MAEEIRELTCINCPMGCQLTAVLRDGEVVSVTGNTCKRGDIYARKEVTHPTRIVTSSVRIDGGTEPVLPVKTASDIPKDRIFDVMRSLTGVRAKAPVHIGDVIVGNAAGTGVDMIACKDIEEA